jgi:hypothetical protein
MLNGSGSGNPEFSELGKIFGDPTSGVESMANADSPSPFTSFLGSVTTTMSYQAFAASTVPTEEAESVPVVVQGQSIDNVFADFLTGNAQADSRATVSDLNGEFSPQTFDNPLSTGITCGPVLLETGFSTCSSPGTIHLEATLDLGDVINLDLFASATANMAFGGIFMADALVDPIISIDPSFPNASDFTIVVSPGIDNTLSVNPASVPEPSSLSILMIPVFVVLSVGWFRRRVSW